MIRILQLSDLHLLAGAAEQGAIYDALTEVLHERFSARGRRVDLLAIEQPLPLLGHDGDRVEARLTSCPARTLLRVYWPLET